MHALVNSCVSAMDVGQVAAVKHRNPAIIVTRFLTVLTTLLLHSTRHAGRSVGCCYGQDIDFSNTLYWSEVSAARKKDFTICYHFITILIRVDNLSQSSFHRTI